MLLSQPPFVGPRSLAFRLVIICASISLNNVCGHTIDYCSLGDNCDNWNISILKSRTMDKLSNMQAFAMVGQTGNFAEAARRLSVANSVVSKRVKDLEDFLGTQLLIRTTRK